MKKTSDPKATRPAAKSQNDKKSHPAHAPVAPIKTKPIPAGSLGPSALPLSGKVTPTALAVAETKKISNPKATRPAAKGQSDEKSRPAHAPAATAKAKPVSASIVSPLGPPLLDKATPTAPTVTKEKKASNSKTLQSASKSQKQNKSLPIHERFLATDNIRSYIG